MGLKKILECDKCGTLIDVPKNCESLIDAVSAANSEVPGWERVSGDRVLCPECLSLYEVLLVLAQ